MSDDVFIHEITVERPSPIEAVERQRFVAHVSRADLLAALTPERIREVVTTLPAAEPTPAALSAPDDPAWRAQLAFLQKVSSDIAKAAEAAVQ